MRKFFCGDIVHITLKDVDKLARVIGPIEDIEFVTRYEVQFGNGSTGNIHESNMRLIRAGINI